MKTKTTHIQKQRNRYESNRQLIEMALRLTTLEYNNFLFEIGMKFIEEMYPVNSTFERYRVKHSRSPLFWKWWRAEWKQWEVNYINYVTKDNYVKFNKKDYQSQFEQMALDHTIEDSYYHIYLKSIADDSL